MLFLNLALLGGLAAISIPIIIHLLNRRSAKIIEWGAMRFLRDSVLTRKRRIQLEEALLMAARCLLVALIALCVARPFVPPGSQVPWVVVLPLFLLGVAMSAVTTVMWPERHLRLRLAGITALLFILCGAAIAVEKWLNLKRFGTAGRKDVALIIDGSLSMTLGNGGTSHFDEALREAQKIVTDAGGGTAFALILGAPVPQARIPQPVVNRAELREAISGLKPVHGKMAAFEAIGLAAVALAQGNNPQKEIIMLTDGQNVGWEIDHPARWEALAHGLGALKSKPKMIVRQFPLPASLRNVAVSNVKFSRQVIGTDRPVGIEVSITNTGTEAVTPAGLELRVGDKVQTNSSLSQLGPGVTETVRFTHHFEKPGGYVVTAGVQVDDELKPDDVWPSVIEVKERLRVLIIDGRPAANFLERAGSFAALALAPGSLSRSPVQTENTKSATADLIDPEVRPVAQLSTLSGFGGYDVVILCDVPALAPSTARLLADFVGSGGGVLLAPGPRAKVSFYNDWRASDGRAMLPVPMIDPAVVAEGSELKPALSTFSHEALRLVADARQSDLGSLLVRQYWQLADSAVPEPGVFVGARLTSGDPFLAARRLGQGTVVLMACALDAGGSNLATRHAFVPLLHELVYHLASPGGQRLNLDPAYTVNVPLTRTRASGGLRGEYFDGTRRSEPVLTRIDPAIEFFWDGAPEPGLPADNFRVRWSGSLVPRFTEEYMLMGEADDSLEVYVNDEQVIGNRRRRDRLNLIAERPVALRVEFIENSGTATARLFWQSQRQRREIIPTACLLPFAPGSDNSSETSGGTFEALGPDGDPRRIELISGREATVARLDERVVPGSYEVTLPESRRVQFADLLTAEGKLAFSIRPDPGEGKLEALDDRAFLALEKYIMILRPKNVGEVIAILTGRQFGEELWKYLAVGALFVGLCEIALARWIAIQRQTGGETAIEFENRFEPRREFQETVEKLRRTA